MTSPHAVRLTLRTAATEAERELAIGRWLQQTSTAPAVRAIVVEGLLFDRLGPQGVPLVGLGAGCPCCAGQVALRVVLGRTLRSLRPDALLVLLATEEHLPRLRTLLEEGALGARFEIEP